MKNISKTSFYLQNKFVKVTTVNLSFGIFDETIFYQVYATKYAEYGTKGFKY